MARKTSSRKARGKVANSSNEVLDGSEISEGRRRPPPSLRHRKKKNETVTAADTTATSGSSTTSIPQETTTDVMDLANDDNHAPNGIADAVATDATSSATASHGQSVNGGMTTTTTTTNNNNNNNNNNSHTPDCQCYLRRLNNSLFLPPSLLMMDDYEAANKGSKR
ncbi:unnamed protein product [Cylindrotheca closterium]|uniref:Uncharacterized protein n=1 Tax=Cylindrotheca closterium TaxID=2856 RepID=A0AAD2JMF5_9STRA|nr:unnamed protein product [Cylindrotheca closterium]